MAHVLNQQSGKNHIAYNGDCVEISRGLPDDSIGYSIYSLPFASLYSYSDSTRDMSNNDSYPQFMKHYGFLVREKLRATKPGRLSSVHCMNLPTSKTHHGYIGIQDFRGDIIREHIGSEAAEFHAAMVRIEERMRDAAKADDNPRFVRLNDIRERMQDELREHPANDGGWVYHSEVCIWKDPVTAMQRTKALGLLHKQLLKDSCMSRQGIPDYVCTFRKPGENPEPVSGPFTEWVGDDSFRSEGKYSIDVWQRYASPVWMDINPTRTLQYTTARDDEDERHICPLQLDVIERCIDLWSNPGDTVLSPFAGIGSETYCAVTMGRKAVGIELKPSYYKVNAENMRIAEAKFATKERSLFEINEIYEDAEASRLTEV